MIICRTPTCALAQMIMCLNGRPKYVVIRCSHPYGFQDPYLIELVTVLVLRSSIKAKSSLERYH